MSPTGNSGSGSVEPAAQPARYGLRCGPVTATSDPHNAADQEGGKTSWDERAFFGTRRGLPWWGAVLLALGVAVVSAVLNQQIDDSLGLIFQIAYFAGCVAAVTMVQRKSLFGPMVQPPLILGATVPSVILLFSGTAGAEDTLGKVLAIGTPLINGFPTMAITTGICVLIGVLRLFRERDPSQQAAAQKSKSSQKSGAAEKSKPKSSQKLSAAKSSDKAEKGRGRAGADDQDGPGQEEPPNRGRAGAAAAGAAAAGAAGAGAAAAARGRRGSRPDDPAERGRPPRRRPGQGRPDQARPDQGRSDQGRPEKGRPEKGGAPGPADPERDPRSRRGQRPQRPDQPPERKPPHGGRPRGDDPARREPPPGAPGSEGRRAGPPRRRPDGNAPPPRGQPPQEPPPPPRRRRPPPPPETR